MIDTSTPVGRAVAATLQLAEKRAWSDISLLDIADEAGLTLVELSKQVASKTAALRAFVRLVDDEVLRKAERREPDESLRERLFDVLMTRLETMTPYKAGLRKIAASAGMMPELIGPMMRSQSWMLAAAGIPADGVRGMARTAGLASVYAATFRDWLDDDDAGMARTMAGLDRRLRRGEGWLKTFDSVAGAGEGLAASARNAFGAATRRRKPKATSSGQQHAQPNEAPAKADPPQNAPSAGAEQLPQHDPDDDAGPAGTTPSFH